MCKENSVMQFVDYKIEKFDYKMNRDFDFNAEHKVQMEQGLEFEVQTVSDDEFIIKLGIYIHGANKKDEPFKLNASILGYFYLEKWQSSNEKQNMVKYNAPAILFPYLRAAVTSITSSANITPYILPTFNFYDLFEDNDSSKNQ